MTRTFMLSFLARQQLVLGARFAARYPRPWLVWEPGVWKLQPQNPSALETRLPQKRSTATPGEGDALCFELVAKPGARLKVGRAETNDIVITDLTVSRDHCVIRLDGTRWVVTASPDVKSLMVAGLPQVPGGEASLFPGDGMQLGDVRLTYYDAPTFERRVAAEAAAFVRSADGRS